MTLARFWPHCAALVALSAVAFGVWVWRSASREVAPPNVNLPAGGRKPSLKAQLAEDEEVTDTAQTARSLSDLQPGMPRTAVEQFLGNPPQSTQPAAVRNERVTYCVTYQVTLAPAGRAPTRTSVTVEFDATKPGHPLIGVRGPVPAF